MYESIFTLLQTIEIPFDPTLFEVGSVEISWHGIFTALAVVAGVAVAARFARKAGFSEEHTYNIALALVIGGIIGARALYVIENWDRFEDDLGEIFSLNTGGIAIYGALIGGGIGAWAYAYFARVPNISRNADIASLGAILGMAVGRVGDIINGEHFAEPTTLPWGVKYTDADSPGFRGDPPLDPAGAITHPAVAYEMLADLAIFAVLLLVYTRSARSGVTFYVWVLLYAGMRLAISFLRLDDTVLGGLRMAQVVAIILMALALPALLYLLRRGPSDGSGAGPRGSRARPRVSRAERRRRLAGGSRRPE